MTKNTITSGQIDTKDRQADIWEKFSQVLLILDKIGIQACLMRDNPINYKEWDEIDILLPLSKLQVATEALAQYGWEVIDTGRFIPHKRAMLLLYQGEFLKLDFHGSVIDGPLIYMDSDWMMSTATKHPLNFYLPSKESWLLHVILHVVLGKPHLHDKYLERISLVMAENLDRQVILEHAKQYGLGLIVNEILENPIGILQDEAKVSFFRRRAVKTLLVSSVANFSRWIYFHLMRVFGQVFGFRKGVLIAIIGPDGAGKSTFLEALEKAFLKLQVPTRKIYMGPWEYNILPTTRFLRWLGSHPLDEIPNQDDSFPMQERLFKLLKGMIKRYAYYINALLEMWARYAWGIFPHLRLRRIVIADRYIYDLEVGYYNTSVKNSRGLRRLISHLTPKPHITILLDNDPETIWQRKKEYPLEVITQALSAYHKIRDRYGFQTVSTDRPIQVIVDEFIENNWRSITRWRKDGN